MKTQKKLSASLCFAKIAESFCCILNTDGIYIKEFILILRTVGERYLRAYIPH